MNNDELKELGETLIGISRGEPWQFFKYSYDWIEVEPGTDPIKVVFNGHKIRLKPWQLTDTINGHTLPARKEWHREDFTKDMLPAPYRPMMAYEKGHDGMEFLDFDGQWKATNASGQESMPGHLHRRTTRPIPAPPVLTPEKAAEGWIEWHGGPCPVEPESVVKCRVRGVSEHSEWKAVAKAIAWEHHNSPGDVIAYKPDPYGHLRQAKAEGKTIQGLWQNEWKDISPERMTFSSPVECYRVKDTTEEPVEWVPLDRHDFDIGTAIRFPSWEEGCYAMVGSVSMDAVHYVMCGPASERILDLFKHGWQINRPCDRDQFGKPLVWHLCRKPAKTK